MLVVMTMKNKMSYDELEKALEESNKLCSKMNMKYINEKNKNDKANKMLDEFNIKLQETLNFHIPIKEISDIQKTLKGSDDK